MNVVIWKLFLLLHLHQCSAVIYNLNASEFNKLPAVFHLDPFEDCVEESNPVYCSTEFVPVSETPNTLLDTIREYSEHTATHFNYSLLRYGVCLNFCKQYKHNTTTDLKHTLEACLNQRFLDKYGLNTSLQYFRCNEVQKKIEFIPSDIIMLVVLIAILLLNLVGSCCDVYLSTENKGLALRTLMLFSVRRNWRQLVAPTATGSEPRLKRLAGLAGLKSVMMILVIVTHTLVSSFFFVDNPKHVEDYYKNMGVQLFLNGPILVQKFFIMSGFLLVYNLLLQSEKHRVDWTMLPRGILLRLIRLTPPYAVLMLFETSWMRFVSTGATWDTAVMAEVADCRVYWWQHLLYINNYNDVSQCFGQTWYLAADMQLYCLGLVVFIACKNPTSRKVVLSLLLFIGLVLPPLHTYFQDLNGILLVSPESINHFFVRDPTYNHLYKRGHTNIFNYVLGMCVGYFVYHLQQVNFDIHKYKKFKIIYMCTFPALTVMLLPSSVLYRDGPKLPMAARIAFATFIKPVFGVIYGTILVGLVFKYENVYRSLVEWRMWTFLGRLSYSAFLVHLTLFRIVLGQYSVMLHLTIIYMFQQACFIVCISLLAAAPCWLLVEQPFGQLMQVLLRPKKAVEENTINLDAGDGATEDTVVTVPSTSDVKV